MVCFPFVTNNEQGKPAGLFSLRHKQWTGETCWSVFLSSQTVDGGKPSGLFSLLHKQWTGETCWSVFPSSQTVDRGNLLVCIPLVTNNGQEKPAGLFSLIADCGQVRCADQ